MSLSTDVQPAAPLPGGKPPRVLIVDDESVVRSVTKLMLERSGFATEEAATASDALVCVRAASSPFAVVVLDYTLPDRVGTDVLPELRQLSPSSRIILSSGRPEEDLPDHGADGYLGKPFTKDQLLAAVRAVMSG